MITVIQSEQRVGDIVAQYTQASNVFKELGIDFCCGGKQTLSDAVRKRRLDEEEVLFQLNKVCTESRPAWPLDWKQDARKLTKLTEHIILQHHDFLRTELPVLRDFVNKVARVHGEVHPELKELQVLYHQLSAELLEHLNKEEQQLFPAIRKAEEEGSASALLAALQILDTLEAEHDEAGDLLSRMRETTKGYMLPEEACMTYTITFRKLEELESDMFTHVHLENNLLFPALAELR
ncbi:iron-sulfur cluster repair di-iron protein [Paenibacillus agaridevorans]|uniref:Iron-sulfur cluster repair di-iron protein n=1 Tax=Paenibacillus agaridevorans TaxID=171404 RepID=A0A2R5EYW2_9BACL|nr:iron-sulfur cluster repair di-iron protein [Paenibacillus agaridevorans]GBG11727.1 iron-sulfur cluster repair di-iron protein [Paenibacillus agaridevorans]